LIQEAVEHFRAARVPEFRFPERAAEALAALNQRSDYLAKLRQETDRAQPALSDIQPEKASLILNRYRSAGFIKEEDGFELLAAYGIPALPPKPARTAEQAAKIANQIGYPVVMKISSPQITHKSDIGGVLLNLNSPEEVIAGFNKLMENSSAMRPDAEVSGVTLQAMQGAGQEVILGAIQDEQFGTLVMFGAGGIDVEMTKDVSFGLAPISIGEADQMISTTWAGKKLAGFRGNPPADKAAVIDALLRLAKLAADFPRLVEIEINPFSVREPTDGALALDVRVKLGS
jgi:acyl-CoA synthetase (NDP forming)